MQGGHQNAHSELRKNHLLIIVTKGIEKNSFIHALPCRQRMRKTFLIETQKIKAKIRELVAHFFCVILKFQKSMCAVSCYLFTSSSLSQSFWHDLQSCRHRNTQTNKHFFIPLHCYSVLKPWQSLIRFSYFVIYSSIRWLV